MTPPAQPQPDEALTPFPDSSYEVLSKSMCEGSDDEANTVSVASTDIPTPDDISSCGGYDDFDDDEDLESNDDETFVNESLPQHPRSPGASTIDSRMTQYSTPADSMMTSRADTQVGEATHLSLKEVSAVDKCNAEACGIIREFNDPSAMPEVLKSYGCPELRLSVQMALSRNVLPICRSFRLLYIGKFDYWAVTDVNNHIGAALNTTPSSSRFNIVQGSEFPGGSSSSRVQLERSGSELVVDHCTMPKVSSDADGESCVTVTLDDGSEITFGQEGKIRPKTACLPDLIIFGHPPEFESVEAEARFRFIRDMLNASGVPSLDIALVRPYSAEAFTFKTKSLRLCVEGRSGSDFCFETRKVLPIDLYTFLALDPAQLNRHLAYLNDHSSPRARSSSAKPESGRWVTYLDDFQYRYAKFVPSLRDLLTALAVSAVVSLCCFSLSPYAVPVLQKYSSQVDTKNEQPVPTSVLTLVSSVTTTMTTSKPAVVSSPAMSVSTDLIVLSEVSSEEKTWHGWPNPSSFFKATAQGTIHIEVINDHEFVIRPSEQLAQLWKKDTHADLSLKRGSDKVAFRSYSSPLPSLTVCLEQKYPFGTFEGEIRLVTGKSVITRRDFEVELGSKSVLASMLENVDRVSQSVKHELAIAQASVKSLSTQATKALQTGLLRMEDGAMAAINQTLYWKYSLAGSLQTVAEHLQEAMEVARRQLDVGSRASRKVSKTLQHNLKRCASGASEVRHVATADAWELTRPWRTSSSLRQARKRALQLRCKVDETLGQDGTKSCELLKEDRYQ